MRVRCPECDTRMEVDDQDLGQEVRCPSCGEEFVARDESPERPHRRSRTADDVDWDEAERLINGPARGLILTGWIGGALFLLLGLVFLVGGIFALGAADPDLRELSVVFLIYGGLSLLLGLPYAAVLAIAGHKMRQLTSTGWAYTGAIMGVISIALCGPVVPLTWAALPIGIWALVVLNKPDVKAALEANSRRR